MTPDFSGVATAAAIGIFAIFAGIIMGFYSIVDYLWLEDTYKTNKRVVPEYVITNINKNGIISTDTTFVYRFK